MSERMTEIQEHCVGPLGKHVWVTDSANGPEVFCFDCGEVNPFLKAVGPSSIPFLQKIEKAKAS